MNRPKLRRAVLCPGSTEACPDARCSTQPLHHGRGANQAVAGLAFLLSINSGAATAMDEYVPVSTPIIMQ